MFAQANASTLSKVIQGNFLVDSLILLVIIVSLAQQIEHASFGMWRVGSVQKLLEVIMTKCQMLVLTQLEISQQQLQLMGQLAYIMYLQVHVSLFYKAMKMKFLKYHSILKETRLLLLAVIKHVDYGQLIREMRCKCQKGMKMKYFLVHSIMKETL